MLPQGEGWRFGFVLNRNKETDLSFDSQTAGNRATHAATRKDADRANSPGAHGALSEDDERMIVLQSWYQRMSAERIARHHGIPAGQVRHVLARRMGGSC